ncbi:thioredoxin [Streptomyces sp. NPDC050504]|uniref:thioredoxin n=1 Tax=Streptomyces sp. NPDC050504 TaxID=3365618 RepID=UPI0037B6AF99
MPGVGRGQTGMRNRSAAGAVVRGTATTRRTRDSTRKRTQDMATVELTKENFDQTVTDNEFVVIDFWAEWCGPCRQFAPVFERVSEKHGDVVFAKVDTEAQPELAAAFEIRSIPTLMVIRENVAVFAQPGALPEAVLEDVIGQARGLDMDEVRKSVEAAQK